MAKKARARVAVPTGTAPIDPAELPVVGLREPCPCGSGKRYKACHGRAARQQEARLVTRPFEGLPAEADWVAMRELVPAATATVRTTAEHGARELRIVTVLPMAWPALHRDNGEVLVALQTMSDSGDASRDVAAALLAALATEPGNPVPVVERPGPGPRLQDVLELGGRFEVAVRDGFDYWLAPDAELTPEVQASIDQADEAVTPTRRLRGVEAGYWCAVGERRHLRWVMTEPEEALLDGLARLHAAGGSGVMPQSRYLGAFRAAGLVVPVWDLPPQTEADDVEAPAAEFAERLGVALASTEPLTALERRARAGVVSRQLTLR